MEHEFCRKKTEKKVHNLLSFYTFGVLLEIDDTIHTNWYNWQGTSKSVGAAVSLMERSTFLSLSMIVVPIRRSRLSMLKLVQQKIKIK
jgi:hypothetical protein